MNPPRLDPWDWLLIAAMVLTGLPIALRVLLALVGHA